MRPGQKKYIFHPAGFRKHCIFLFSPKWRKKSHKKMLGSPLSLWIIFKKNLRFKVTRKYVAVARIMKAYEEQKYTVWREQVASSLMSYLKKNLLTRASTSSVAGRSTNPTSEPITADSVLPSVSTQKSQGKLFRFDNFFIEFLEFEPVLPVKCFFFKYVCKPN